MTNAEKMGIKTFAEAQDYIFNNMDCDTCPCFDNAKGECVKHYDGICCEINIATWLDEECIPDEMTKFCRENKDNIHKILTQERAFCNFYESCEDCPVYKSGKLKGENCLEAYIELVAEGKIK